MKSMQPKSIEVYEMLWNENFPAISRGEVEIDPYIANPGSDQRRGLTLIFRPSAGLLASILEFLSEIQEIEPYQYFYSSSNLHFTVLPLFTATPDYQAQYAGLAHYEKAVQDAILEATAFSLQITGLTVSRGAVMVCGYSDSGVLNTIRDNLRQDLNRRGLSAGLDQRYKLVTAHSTIMRFSTILQKPQAFARFLLENRKRSFGSFTVSELQLVKNDWYMSQQHTPVIATYPLYPDPTFVK
jgi:2'-5' RNA ligase